MCTTSNHHSVNLEALLSFAESHHDSTSTTPAYFPCEIIPISITPLEDALAEGFRKETHQVEYEQSGFLNEPQQTNITLDD